MSDQPTRRHFLQIALGTGAAAALLPACKSSTSTPAKALDCTDVSALSPNEIATRTTLGYVDATPEPAKTCLNCLQYIAGAANNCGACKVIKGPIHPAGYCKVWVAIPPA